MLKKLRLYVNIYKKKLNNNSYLFFGDRQNYILLKYTKLFYITKRKVYKYELFLIDSTLLCL